MNKEVKVLCPYPSGKSDYCEFGAMALLLVLALVQITVAFNEGSAITKSHSPIGSIMQSHDKPMFANK